MQEKRNELNTFFNSLTERQRISLVKKELQRVKGNPKAVTTGEQANSHFKSVNYPQAKAMLKTLIEKSNVKTITEQNKPNVALSENSYGLMKQVNIIEKYNEYAQICKLIKDKKAIFHLVGFMTFSEFTKQIKVPGKFDVKFVSDVKTFDKNGKETTKLTKDSISLELIKRASKEYIKNEIDFNNLLTKGGKLAAKLDLLRNGNAKQSEVLSEVLTMQGLPKSLTITELRFIYFIGDKQAIYNAYNLPKLYANETQILNFEKLALSLDKKEREAIKETLSKVNKVVSLAMIGEAKNKMLLAEKNAKNKAKNAPKNVAELVK
jgi:hypothetical protein